MGEKKKHFGKRSREKTNFGKRSQKIKFWLYIAGGKNEFIKKIAEKMHFFF